MREPVRLHPDDCEAIARRVAELLREEPARPAASEVAQLLTAQEVAERFGLSRDWVYEHQEQLGVIRLGDGLRPRLRFDRTRVAEALNANGATLAQSKTPVASGTRRPRARTRATAGDSPLLPYEGMEA